MGPKKVAVPLKDEKPIMGLVSDKNFIVSNAVENILAAPKLPTNNEKDFLKKKNYGKVPKYLQTIKKEIEDSTNLSEKCKSKRRRRWTVKSSLWTKRRRTR